MADSVTTQESGGGEGVPVKPVESAPEVKPADPVKTEPAEQKEVKPEATVETLTEVKPAENVEAPKAPETEIKAEIKADVKTEVLSEVVVEAKAEVDSKLSAENVAKAEVPITAETPKVDEASVTAETLKAAETPVTAETPKAAEISVTAETPKAAEISVTAETPKAADTPVTNEAPKVVELPEATQAPVPLEVKDEKLPEVKQDGVSNGNASGSSDWQQKELALLQKIQELEKLKDGNSGESLRMQLKVKEEEVDLLKARVRNLETELQAAMSKPGAKNHEMIENIKQQHEELLSKARGMIFDKTKMVKNQELQIEALTTQVQSLKDINLITKDLLEIRNSEIKAMEDRLIAMEARFKTEKDRYSLVLERAQTSSNINDDLKQEYITQLKIFKELRLKYEQKVEALVAENNKLKMDLVKNGGGPSAAPK